MAPSEFDGGGESMIRSFNQNGGNDESANTFQMTDGVALFSTGN